MPNYSFSLPILLPHRRLGKQSRRLLLRARWRGNARLLADVAHGEVLKVGGGGVLGQKEAAGVVVTVAPAVLQRGAEARIALRHQQRLNRKSSLLKCLWTKQRLAYADPRTFLSEGLSTVVLLLEPEKQLFILKFPFFLKENV